MQEFRRILLFEHIIARFGVQAIEHRRIEQKTLDFWREMKKGFVREKVVHIFVRMWARHALEQSFAQHWGGEENAGDPSFGMLGHFGGLFGRQCRLMGVVEKAANFFAGELEFVRAERHDLAADGEPREREPGGQRAG